MPRKKEFVFLKQIGCEEVVCSKCGRSLPKLSKGYWCADKGEYACTSICVGELKGDIVKGIKA